MTSFRYLRVHVFVTRPVTQISTSRDGLRYDRAGKTGLNWSSCVSFIYIVYIKIQTSGINSDRKIVKLNLTRTILDEKGRTWRILDG